MEIRIGIVQAPREVTLDMADDTTFDDVKGEIDSGVANGGLVWLTDKRGRQTGFPADRIAYVELGLPSDEQKIGFS